MANVELSQLEEAILSGDVNLAADVAKQLAQQKTPVRLLCLNEPSIGLPAVPEKQIKIKIFIEDKFTSGISVTWTLSPSVTINTLKQLMYKKFEFPLEVQKWIVGKRVAMNEDTLSRCGVTSGNAVVYLYLVSAKSVGLTRRQSSSIGQDIAETALMTHAGHHADQLNLAMQLAPTINPLEALNQRVRQELVQPADIGPVNTRPVILPETGWQCRQCTFINEPTRPGCAMCTADKPQDYTVPDNYEPSEAELQRLHQERHLEELELLAIQENYKRLIATDESDLVSNVEQFECPICFTNIIPQDGVVLRDCLHTFCRECLEGHVQHADSSVVSCPFDNGQYRCTSVLQDREIKAVVSSDIYLKHLTLSLQEAESRAPNSFHCQTPNCTSWCFYEDDVNTFECEMCGKENCLTCKAIHVGLTCKQYQEDIKEKARNDIAAQRTQSQIDEMLRSGDAMKCPTCNIILMKKDGCDWIRCSMCKTEICWVTRGARWGPDGEGDISGGCRCNVDDKICHPNCQNCH